MVAISFDGSQEIRETLQFHPPSFAKSKKCIKMIDEHWMDVGRGLWFSRSTWFVWNEAATSSTSEFLSHLTIMSIFISQMCMNFRTWYQIESSPKNRPCFSLCPPHIWNDHHDSHTLRNLYKEVHKREEKIILGTQPNKSEPKIRVYTK